MFHTSVGCDSLTELNLWALPHPAVNIHDDYSCLTAWHSIVAETDAPFHKWTAYPETAALEGHEDDLSFPIKPNDSIVFSFFADYSETPICPTTQSITIHPITNVSAEIGITTTTLTPEHHNIQAWDNSVGNSNRSWYINNTYIHDSASFSYSASLDEDSILLQLIAFNDYCSDTAQKNIKINTETFFAPNIFTPDLNSNNRFLIIDKHIISCEINIYSRTGQLVFHTLDVKEGWDGTHDGSKCPMGTYVYVIRYALSHAPNEWHSRTGNITLVR